MRALVKAAVADHGQMPQPEALLELGDLRPERRRIGGIAVEHLHRHRAAVGGAQQADHQLRTVATMVAAVTMLGQRAVPPFEVGGGDIV